MRLVAAWLTGLVLAGCGETPAPGGSPADTSTYDVEIRWTSYGIPHVKARDWCSLGFGFAYATATDAVCVIAKDVAMVNGGLSEHFSREGTLESDVFHKAILTDGEIAACNAAQSSRGNTFSSLTSMATPTSPPK